MVAQEKLISAEEFWEIQHHPDFAGQTLELAEGVLVAMSRPGMEHGLTVVSVVIPFSQYVEQHDLGYVTVESGYVLFKNPGGNDTVRGPDAAFVSKARAPEGFAEGYAPFAPDLAVEVVSPGDLVFEVEAKVDEYLRAGTKIVWVISPRSKTVTVYTQTDVSIVSSSGVLDGGEVLPGFRLPVAAIFPR